MSNSYTDLPFELPPPPTEKRRIVFSFGLDDIEFFKCFPSDDFLGARYDRNPAQLVVVWDVLLRPYHCELQIFSPRNQLLVAFPISKSLEMPYTIVDGMINEWVTKEEFVYFQFVFTKDSGEFVKSTLPLRMNLSEANRPDYFKVIKPLEFDRMKALYDQSVTSAMLRFDDENGWVYDFFSSDNTLRFSLGWIPTNVVRGSEQLLTPNEKMVARANINVPFTFVLPLAVADGVNVSKPTTKFINSLINATFEVWEDVGNGNFVEVLPISKGYNASSVSVVLPKAVSGYIRVSCKSERFVPSGNSTLVGSEYSGNALMDEDNLMLYSNEVQDE